MDPLLNPTIPTWRKSLPTLQPSYFTSALFVDPLRRDIDGLLKAFLRRCSVALHKKEQISPFSWFKAIWKDQRWDLLHLRVVESRARRAFVDTVLRLFIERIVPSEPGLNQLTAFFGLYTFYNTQPRTPDLALYYQAQILIPIDTYQHLLSLPTFLPPGFDHYAHYIMQSLIDKDSFSLLPRSELGPFNPPIDYHPGLQMREASISIPAPKNKPGRPRALEIQKRNARNLSALDKWATTNMDPSRSLNMSIHVNPLVREDGSYLGAKEASSDEGRVEVTWENMLEVDAYAQERWLRYGREGVERVERAGRGPSGLLGLVALWRNH
ncbi:hypothetical protein BS47DRAFT_1356177, partial [Hydnum rufescens UP504]